MSIHVVPVSRFEPCLVCYVMSIVPVYMHWISGVLSFITELSVMNTPWKCYIIPLMITAP